MTTTHLRAGQRHRSGQSPRKAGPVLGEPKGDPWVPPSKAP